ncbi:MAG: hypothetical protein IJJ66_11370 [Treponema sp.]|nr:hypothetical protein [Treponema sp.]MBR0477404.1 hypothetical protein [Treponema sp.]
MDNKGVLDSLLRSFASYYDVKTEGVLPPFAAQATFNMHNEQYFLVKAAQIAQIDSNEFVYIASEENLNQQKVNELAEAAWFDGLSKVKPDSNHRNSDVTLIIICNTIEENSFSLVKKLKHYKSYLFGFHGWSNFRALAYEVSTGKMVTNRLGKPLKKLVCNL